jgi:hypothetical protein
MRWERIWRGVAPTLAVLTTLLSGCTSYVTTQVTAFSNWSGNDATRTYAFARTAEQQNSLEQATYEQIVANELETYAFRRVRYADAHYTVSLSYSTHGQTVSVSQPAYYPGPWVGPFWRPIDPWGPYGLFPPSYVTETYPVFTHTLGIRMTERASGKEVYNVTARNTDEENSLVPAMPYLARGALADFPLGNGVVRTVRIPRDKNGGGLATNEVAAAPAAASGAAAASSAARQ